MSSANGLISSMYFKYSCGEGSFPRTEDMAASSAEAKNTSAPATDVLYFDETNATADDTWFNDTTPTSSVFSVDGSGAVNNNGQTLIAYLFSISYVFLLVSVFFC